MIDWLNFWSEDEIFFKKLAICGFITVLTISTVSLYTSYNYKNNIKDLKTELNTSKYENKVLNSKVLEYENKISILEENSIKLKNTNNWNYLFNTDVYNMYSNSEKFYDLINFDHQSFITFTAFKIMQIEFLEYRTKLELYKIIYGPKMHWSLNNFNITLIDYEIKYFFNKTKFMYCDYEMNNLLFKQYGNTYPHYEPFYTPLKHLIKPEKIPYSYSPEYTKKYLFNNMYYNLNYINRGIQPFE